MNVFCPLLLALGLGGDLESLVRQAHQWVAQAEYSKAEQTLLAALQRVEPSGESAAVILNNLGSLYQDQGRLLDAKRCYEQSIRIWESAGGVNLAQPLNNLGGVYRALGLYGKAEQAYLRSLEMRERVHGPDHPDVARVWNNLALVYRAQGRGGQAEEAGLRALRILEQAPGPSPLDIAAVRTNLGGVYYDQRRFADAEQQLQQAIRISRDHPGQAQTLLLLASVYVAEGQAPAAEPLLRRAIEVTERAFGPEHPDLAPMLGQYATVLRRTGRKQEAREASRRAKTIREASARRDLLGRTMDATVSPRGSTLRQTASRP
jgi:tetratricopeptide (TPR) repeat protein